MEMPRHTQDLRGNRFGRLLVIERAPERARYALWRCLCDCGNVTVVASASLRLGRTKSCGCWRREMAAAKKTTHGYTGRHSRGRYRLYTLWNAMKQRCLNSNQRYYERYGGRGITTCDRWLEFANFLADMGEPPSGEHTLVRIDDNRGYEPGNVRWAIRRKQRVNSLKGIFGSRHGRSKLTERDVEMIRSSPLTGVQLAQAFGVAPSVISGIRRGRSWKHVT